MTDHDLAVGALLFVILLLAYGIHWRDRRIAELEDKLAARSTFERVAERHAREFRS